MVDISRIDAIHLDALKEVFNIGAGNAATRLSQILSRKVEMKVPNTKLVGFNDLLTAFGKEDTVVLGVMLLLEGDLDGSMIFILPKASAGIMLSPLLGKQYTEDTVFDEMDFSAAKEIGNIIVSAYVGSLSAMTSYNIRVSEPFATIDMTASILSVPVIELGQFSDNVILMESYIACDGIELGGHFMMLPSLNSYEKIMKAFGM